MNSGRAHRAALIGLLLAALTAPALAMGPRDLDRPGRLQPDSVAAQDGPVSMAADAAGIRWAAWSYVSGLEADIAVSRSVGETWLPSALLGAGNGLIDSEPAIAFLADGRAVVAWTQRAHADDRTHIVFSFLATDGWSAPARVNDAGTIARSPRLLPLDSGLAIVFVDDRGTLVSRRLAVDEADSSATQTKGRPTNGTTVKPLPSAQDSSGTMMGDGPFKSGSNGPDPMPTIRLPPPDHKPGDPPVATTPY